LTAIQSNSENKQSLLVYLPTISNMQSLSLHIERISLLIENFCHVPSTRTRKWLPQIAHFHIFVLGHKNAKEPAGVLPHTGRTPAAVVVSVMADVIGFCGKLLVLSDLC
jgi:hypothetical protein